MTDAQYTPRIYREQGGNRLVVKDGGEVVVRSGGQITVEAGGLIDYDDDLFIHYEEVTLTAQEVKALKATPIELVAAPGAGFAAVPVAINLVAHYGGTNAFTETADDLSVGYDGGAELKEIESTGLIDQTNDEWRYITFEHGESFVPEEATAIVLTNLDDEIAGNAANDNTLDVRLYYRVVPTGS